MNKGEIEIEQLGIEESAGYKNLIAIRDYAVLTRKMFRDLQAENKIHITQIQQQNILLESMKKQIQLLQVNSFKNK